MKNFIGRKRELSLLNEFVKEEGAQLTYLRGRRRIGKSLLLKQFKKQTPLCFYFSGLEDTRNKETIKLFIQEWETFTKETTLSELAPNKLSWGRVFQEVSKFIERTKQTVILALDEIQWIAKEKSGFLGSLKRAWDDWQSFQNIKIILCGSSQKFFETKSGNENVTLRGLKTFAEIWVLPFSPAEIKKYIFPYWTYEQICLIYTLTGGVPYYLNEIGDDPNFIRAINKAYFTRSTIFLDEVDEVLKLDFNQATLKTIKKILAAMSLQGVTQNRIIQKTKLPRATIYDCLQKLQNYKIVYTKNKIPSKNRANQRDELYYIKDFYLNFYFAVLYPLQKEIKFNNSELSFTNKVLSSKNGYFIPNFSGFAFELLVSSFLENYEWRESKIFSKLHLINPSYEVGCYWEDQASQIDIVVSHNADRETRLIECKWLNQGATLGENTLQEILEKTYPNTQGHHLSHFLMSSKEYSPAFKKMAASKRIGLLELKDLF